MKFNKIRSHLSQFPMQTAWSGNASMLWIFCIDVIIMVVTTIVIDDGNFCILFNTNEKISWIEQISCSIEFCCQTLSKLSQEHVTFDLQFFLFFKAHLQNSEK